MGTFVKKTAGNGQFFFNLKADNGQVILTSEQYTTRASRDNGIESVKENAPKDERYDKRTAANGQYFFNLKASNGQVIGTSEMYVSESGRNGGIDSVQRNAASAATVEE